MKKAAFILILLMLFGNIQPVLAQNNAIYVSPNGSDKNSGSIDSPFETLEAARDYIRDLKNTQGLPKGGIVVYLRGGDYEMKSIFRLDSRDSGTKSAPIKYTAYGNENVRLLGGVNVDNFEKLTDEKMLKRLRSNVRDKAYCADLTEYLSEYNLDGVPSLKPCGVANYYDMSESSPILFKNGEMMTYARYPNDGFLTIKNVIKEGKLDKDYEDDVTDEHHEMAEFGYSYEDSKKWVNPGDVWIFGYFRYRWADWFAPAEVNTAAQTIKMKRAYSQSGYAPTEGKEFYFSNVFEELDAENEFYIDRKTKKLYVISENLEDCGYELAMMNGGIVHMKDCAYITFENIKMSLSRSNIFKAYNCNNISVINCEISKGGTAGIIFDRVKDSEIKNNLVCWLGSRGILVSNAGGNAELDAGNVNVENNKVHDFAKLETTYKPAITLNGYKNRAAHNEMYNTTHNAFIIQGQDNIFEYNDVHDCLLTAEDAGAVYLGRKWSETGNVFRYNYFHDLPKGAGGAWRNNAIYFDDGFLGGEVYGNTFKNLQCGIFSHGGRKAIMNANVFIDCDEPINIVNWAYPYQRTQMTEIIQNNYLIVPHWKYYKPESAEMIDNPDNEFPINNTVTNNILFNSGEVLLSDEAKKTGTVECNVMAADKSIFEDFDNGNFTIKKNSPILKQLKNFEVVDFTKIGNTGTVGTITK